MNIFVLSDDPQEAAKFHCDKHVLKMILESGQMLCAAHWTAWGRELNIDVSGKRGSKDLLTGSIADDLLPPWKLTHASHPCTRWAQETRENYLWLSSLSLSLCDEYERRYGRVHKSRPVLKWLQENLPPSFPGEGRTPFAVAMPDVCKVSDDAVTCYREYYRVSKRRFAKWRAGSEPEWFTVTSSDEP